MYLKFISYDGSALIVEATSYKTRPGPFNDAITVEINPVKKDTNCRLTGTTEIILTDRKCNFPTVFILNNDGTVIERITAIDYPAEEMLPETEGGLS